MAYYGVSDASESATYTNGVLTSGQGSTGANIAGDNTSAPAINNANRTVTLPNGAQVVLDANGNIVGGDPTNGGQGVTNNAGAISSGAAGTPVSNPSTVPSTTQPQTAGAVTAPTNATGSSGQGTNLTPAEQASQTATTQPVTALTMAGLTGTPASTAQPTDPNASIEQGIQSVTKQVQQLQQAFPAALAELQKSSSAVPQSQGTAAAAVSTAVQSATSAITDEPDAESTASNNFSQGYSTMSPAMQMIYSLVQSITSPSATAQTFQQQYQSVSQNTPFGSISDLQTQYMNIENVINGTPNDIRNEITAAGGMATESEVQGMSTARNQTLVLQANSLQTALGYAQDYVSNIMGYSEADQSQVNQSVNQKIGLVEEAASMQQSLDTTAGSNYNKTLTALGDNYTAFAATIPANMQAYAEYTMGLPAGTLSNPTQLASMTTAALKQENLQNTTLMDIATENEKSEQGAYYGFRSTQAADSAAQEAISNYTSLPAYEAYTNAQSEMSVIQSALDNPGSVSQSDLISAYKGLVTQNPNITDNAASSVTGGTGIQQELDKFLQTFNPAGGTQLSPEQIQQIGTLSQAIYAGYTAQYTPIYNEALGSLQSQGLPTTVLPTPGVTQVQPTAPQTGQTVVDPTSGNSYIVGQVYNDGTSNWTIDADGNWTQSQ